MMRNYRMRDGRLRSNRMRDGRNPYGSRGGYVVSERERRDYGRMADYGRIPEYRSGYSDMAHSRPYTERDGNYNERPYEYDRDFGGVRRVGEFQYDTIYDRDDDYGYDRLTSRELKDWERDLIYELKPEHRDMFDRANFEKRAKELGFDDREYSLEELYITALMMETDYGTTVAKFGANNLDTMICLAKDFLSDPDSDLRFGEKLASYYLNVACVE